MIYISHRGNILGPNPEQENSLSYIQYAIDLGFDCEIDVNLIDSCLYLGHDSPQYKIDLNWLIDRKSKLWVHCKNLESISFLSFINDLNYFWHEKDKVTLTRKGYIWAYPGMQPVKNSIAVLPELYNDSLIDCIGVCTDYINKYYCSDSSDWIEQYPSKILVGGSSPSRNAN